MTDEQLNTMEALAKAPGEWGMRIEQSLALELIALARVGLARQQGTIGHPDVK